MHRANLHNMTSFLTLEYAIPTTSGHACHVQQLRAVDHVVICKERLAIIYRRRKRVRRERQRGLTLATSDTNAFGFYLEA
jgi:hypothetical protein